MELLSSHNSIANMGWYSLLPPYLTVVETWIIRIAVRLDLRILMGRWTKNPQTSDILRHHQHLTVAARHCD